MQKCIGISGIGCGIEEYGDKAVKKKGLSIRQISRLTGVSKGLVERAARR